MKKNNFIDGAIIVTIGLVLCKVLGIIYVIPFRSLVGTTGGALYSYAYSIYGVFVSLSATGIPIAISKIVSEYNTLGYKKSKVKAFKIGNIIISILGIVCFLILFIFAPFIAKLIIGDATGGNTVSDVIKVVRIISTAILFVPLLSVYRGYMQGHRIMSISSLSTVLEQFVRVIVIVLGSFLAIKVFNLNIQTAVGLATFGATVGALIAYFYIFFKVKKNKKELMDDSSLEQISTKEIIKKIIFYAIPFILIDVIRSAYSTIDTFTVVRNLTDLGYPTLNAENVAGIITTWGNKLNAIIISIATGLVTSLIPNIVINLTNKDNEGINNKLNQTLQVLFFMIMPMTFGLILVARPIWILFYGYDAFSIGVFKVYIIQALSFSLFFTLTNVGQTLNKTKLVLITLFSTFILKWVSNTWFINMFHNLGIDAYYAPTINTILIHFLGSIVLLIGFKISFKTSYKTTFKSLLKISFNTLLMSLVIIIVKYFISFNSFTRVDAIIEVLVVIPIGILVYFVSAYKTKSLKETLGESFINKILNKLKLKKS